MIEPNNKVRLLKDVPLFPDQEHQRLFSDRVSQESYFLSRPYVYDGTDASYIRKDQELRVPVPFDQLYDTNYLLYKNDQYGGKWFYAFITDKRYVNPDTTAITFELDVFQTWFIDVTVGQSFVEREHQDRWDASGNPIVNTVDEGLAYGTEYETVSVDQIKPYGDLYFMVIVSKSAMHRDLPANGGADHANEIMPSVNGLPQPLSYYIHPFRLDGSVPDLVVGGSAFTLSSVSNVLKGAFTQTNAVNNVVSLYVTEYIGEILSYDGATLTLGSANFEGCYVVDNNNTNMNTIHVKTLPTYSEQGQTLGDKYSGYNAVTESKLLMHPYCVTVLDDMKGNRVELKNEYIGSDDLVVTVKGSLGTSNKVSYQVDAYLQDGVTAGDQYVPDMEHALINNNPNDLPIITDLLSAYLQGNRNSLQNQRNQILFNGVTNAMMGAVGGGMIGVGAVAGAVAGAGMGAMNTYYQIEGLNAKKQDISNTPPSMSQMGTNTAFDYGNGYSGCYAIKKQITAEYRKKLEDFFHLFGYRVNELKVPNLYGRQFFNYVKTVGANLTGNVPQDALTALRSMFDHGITLWHTDDVRDYAVTNDEV